MKDNPEVTIAICAFNASATIITALELSSSPVGREHRNSCY